MEGISVAHESVRPGVEPDLCSVSPGRVETLLKLELRVVIEADSTRANSEKFEPGPSYDSIFRLKVAQTFAVYSGGRVPSSGFSDWPAQQKMRKKKICHYNSSPTVPNYKLALLMMITTQNLN
jgi:hypothetical protein